MNHAQLTTMPFSLGFKGSSWIHLNEIDWSLERLQNGMWVKLKEVPFLA